MFDIFNFLWDQDTQIFFWRKKSHTCEEGGAQPRIPVWHLLINLKNNYLFKKLLKWANKKCKNFYIYIVVFFFKKNKEKHLEMLFTHVHQKSWWYDSHFLRQTEIGNYGSFFHLLPFPLKTQKIRILKKWKKLLEISFYTCVPLKITIIWGSIPEIESETDRIFCPFTPLPSPLTTQKIKLWKKWKKYQMSSQVYQKPRSYDVCFLIYGGWQTEICVILGHFLPFYPTKMPGDIIILHKCTRNHDHMLYCS